MLFGSCHSIFDLILEFSIDGKLSKLPIPLLKFENLYKKNVRTRNIYT